MLMEVGSHADCCCCNFPNSAAAAVLMQYSYISAVTVITITIIDCTAAITLRPTPAPIWRDADIAHVTRSDEEAPPRHVPVQG
ncbi:hypothetical protein PTSG_02555 [Salpingoeca rosetta]|uniref:Uncharacterized protein n=1 Tax=Salpingoeca rosetta (strain ATCC 50818 / BSB-021) TaxID=946362 RepID=F2U2I8_SALR5|nr:uncharacterized protein PTSG_02555 [Salpingoeca rosetta]EGD81840.1 hypothetical protein PTSG_02555 [Salpingoeca rosetta]|eukprot:XP_004997044.1 hypothetical protein PTSG_02555 [Salpingoeca rosetta]